MAGRGYQFVAEVQVGAIAVANEVATPPEERPKQWFKAWLAEPRGEVTPGRPGPALLAMLGHCRDRDRPAPCEKRPLPAWAVVTLAVLPFKPLTAADRNESLEFGMAETLIAGLNALTLSVSPAELGAALFAGRRAGCSRGRVARSESSRCSKATFSAPVGKLQVICPAARRQRRPATWARTLQRGLHLYFLGAGFHRGE